QLGIARGVAEAFYALVEPRVLPVIDAAAGVRARAVPLSPLVRDFREGAVGSQLDADRKRERLLVALGAGAGLRRRRRGLGGRPRWLLGLLAARNRRTGKQHYEQPSLLHV